MNSHEILQIWLQNPELAEPIKAFGLVTAAAVVGATAMVAGTVMSYQANRRAQRAEKRRRGIQERQERVNRMREERNLLRQMQTGHAYSLVQGGASGTLGSSAFYGTMNEVSGATAYGMSSVEGNWGRAMEMRSANDAIARARGQAQAAGMLTSLGSALLSNSISIGKIGGAIKGHAAVSGAQRPIAKL